ncbi:RepB family plasmid replication initiator protein [Salmonella enterica]|nr:RepB family plasmid replication initiator protein [Salmonella enterica]EKK6596276.1 RepB family plasmid replication initiator protein [Salmonella enterica]
MNNPENDSENSELTSPLAVVNPEKGTSFELIPNSAKTVQPVALLRLSVFTPVSPKERGKRDFKIDASEELASMEMARSEGFTNIKIQGMKLNMSTDFKTWIGIIQAFSRHGFTSEEINLTFHEFATMCGLRSTDINGRARARLQESLTNLASVVLSFSNKTKSKFTVTHLVQRAELCMETDKVTLLGDARMWELYRYDHKILVGLKALKELSRKEAAQSLYVYLESMPPGALYITMKRFRDRLSMISPVRVQNQVIRRALADLERIGYLKYSEAKKGRDIQFYIVGRNPKLTAKDG